MPIVKVETNFPSFALSNPCKSSTIIKSNWFFTVERNLWKLVTTMLLSSSFLFIAKTSHAQYFSSKMQCKDATAWKCLLYICKRWCLSKYGQTCFSLRLLLQILLLCLVVESNLFFQFCCSQTKDMQWIIISGCSLNHSKSGLKLGTAVHYFGPVLP